VAAAKQAIANCASAAGLAVAAAAAGTVHVSGRMVRGRHRTYDDRGRRGRDCHSQPGRRALLACVVARGRRQCDPRSRGMITAEAPVAPVSAVVSRVRLRQLGAG
jgi:hypothetical protein